MAMHPDPDRARVAPEPAHAPFLARKQDLDPSDAWHALMHGGWVVAEHAVAAGTIVVQRASRPSGDDALTTEELRVAMGRARGESIEALALETGRTCGAVTERIANVMRKLRLHSQAELAVFFHEASRRLSATRLRYGGGDYLVLTYPAPRRPSGAASTE